MKILTILFLAVIFAMSALAQQTIRTQLDIRNKRNEPALKVTTPSAQTANMIEVYKGTVLTFSVPYTGIIPAANGGTGSDDIGTGLQNIGLRSGTLLVSSDGTVTNTFSPAFGRSPVVVLTPKSAVPQGSNAVYVVSVTTSNVVVFGHTNTTYNFLAAQPQQ